MRLLWATRLLSRSLWPDIFVMLQNLTVATLKISFGQSGPLPQLMVQNWYKLLFLSLFFSLSMIIKLLKLLRQQRDFLKNWIALYTQVTVTNTAYIPQRQFDGLLFLKCNTNGYRMQWIRVHCKDASCLVGLMFNRNSTYF